MTAFDQSLAVSSTEFSSDGSLGRFDALEGETIGFSIGEGPQGSTEARCGADASARATW
jgi:hypothetical protein